MSKSANEADIGPLLHARGWHVTWTLEESRVRWEKVTRDLQAPYWGCMEDYTNALYVRKWIEEALELLSEIDAIRFKEMIDPLDARFISETSLFDGKLPGAGPEWWFLRIPNCLGALADWPLS